MKIFSVLFLFGILGNTTANAGWKPIDVYFHDVSKMAIPWGLDISPSGTPYSSFQIDREDPPANGSWLVRKMNNNHQWQVVDDFQFVQGHECRAAQVRAVDDQNIFVIGNCLDGVGVSHWVIRRNGKVRGESKTVLDIPGAEGQSVTSLGSWVLAAGTMVKNGIKTWTVLRSNDRGASWKNLDTYAGTSGFGARAWRVQVSKNGEIFVFGSVANGKDWALSHLEVRKLNIRTSDWITNRVSQDDSFLKVDDVIQTHSGQWVLADIISRQSKIANVGTVRVSADGLHWQKSLELVNAPEHWAGFQGVFEHLQSKSIFAVLEFQKGQTALLRTFVSGDGGKNWQEKEVYQGIDKFGAFPLTIRGDNQGHLYCGASSFPQDPEKGSVSGRKAEILEWVWN